MMAMAMYSCGDDAEKASDKQGKEYTSAYICPMHCKGSGSDKAGNCPVCKMAYVANKDAKAAPASHDGHDHSGHNHDGHDHSGHSHDDGHDHSDHDGHNH